MKSFCLLIFIFLLPLLPCGCCVLQPSGDAAKVVDGQAVTSANLFEDWYENLSEETSFQEHTGKASVAVKAYLESWRSQPPIWRPVVYEEKETPDYHEMLPMLLQALNMQGLNQEQKRSLEELALRHECCSLVSSCMVMMNVSSHQNTADFEAALEAAQKIRCFLQTHESMLPIVMTPLNTIVVDPLAQDWLLLWEGRKPVTPLPEGWMMTVWNEDGDPLLTYSRTLQYGDRLPMEGLDGKNITLSLYWTAPSTNMPSEILFRGLPPQSAITLDGESIPVEYAASAARVTVPAKRNDDSRPRRIVIRWTCTADEPPCRVRQPWLVQQK